MVSKKLIKRVDNLKAELKDATGELNAALSETELYKKFVDFALGEDIAEKPAKAQALKVTLDFYKAKLSSKDADATRTA